ncbi:MAG: MFS transporter [Ktedonobacteraceae bacterium]|nr:MFS transporter [Ktedonobacteraceae bacterium]MBO0792165.1 MFS transporter [Ktedonobacteraceae bacterium]
MHRKHTLPLWRNLNFLLLWCGQIVSTLGTSISKLALPLLILALTHSPAQAGLLAAVRQAPYILFSLPAGALVDRWNRKAVMIYCDIARWLALGSVPLAFVSGHLSVPQLYIAASIEGTAYVFFSLAQISALPQIVPPERVPQACALDTTTEYIGLLLGPGLGALLIGLAPAVVVGAALAYLVDSASYLVSVVSLLFIRAPFQVERVWRKPATLWQDVVEGLRFLWHHPLLRIMVLLTTAVNFLQGPLSLATIVLAQGPLKLDVFTLGFVMSMSGIGGILGAIIAPWLHTRLRFGWLIIGSVILWALAQLLMALASWVPPLMLGLLLVGLLWPVYTVVLVSYRLSAAPDALQGRVNSAFRFLSFGGEPLGTAIGGLLLASLGPRVVLGLSAAGLALCALVVTMTQLRTANPRNTT